MRRLSGKMLTSYVSNAFLVSLIFFLATYFFIGNNVSYLAKTPNEINNEFLAMADYLIGEDVKSKELEEVLRYAATNNLGVALELSDGRRVTRELTEQQLILKLEFGGKVVTKEAQLETNGGKVTLTYFRPYLSTDDTRKFLPAFLRLTFVFITLAMLIVCFSAFNSILTIRNDLKKAKALASNLVKGSYQNVSGEVNLLEFKELLEQMSSLRDVILRKEDLKKRMTSDFAHELRTPLTTLQTHLEALIDGVWEPSTERFISCHEEILRLIRLVGDLERLNKFEDENVTLNKSRFNLTELIKSISLNFQGDIKKNSIDFNIIGDKQEVYADKDKISQVIINLLSNSLKYTPDNGKVLVNVKGDKNYVYLIVNDSGVGIPGNDIAHVFNRLYRSDTSRARASGGAGIGLTIAKSIVEAHNGSIDIVSQEGLGTEVTVILPRCL